MPHLVIPYNNWLYKPDFNLILNEYVQENKQDDRFINLTQVKKDKKEDQDFFFVKNQNELAQVILRIEKERNDGALIISSENDLQKDLYPIREFSVCEKDVNGKFKRENGVIRLNRLVKLDYIRTTQEDSSNIMVFLLVIFGILFTELLFEPALVIILTLVGFFIVFCSGVSNAPYRTTNDLVTYRYACAFIVLGIGVTFCSIGFGVLPGAFLVGLGSFVLLAAVYGQFEIQNPYVDYKSPYSIQDLDVMDNVINGTIYSPGRIFQQGNDTAPSYSSSALISSDYIAESLSTSPSPSTLTHRKGSDTKSTDSDVSFDFY